LSKLKSLTDLRFKSNPLNQSDRKENIRQYFIAKLLKLEYLNRTKVEYSERMGSEIDYLKKYVNDWLETKKIKSKLENFQFEHPTYQILAKSIK
jgi:hypothetical protein